MNDSSPGVECDLSNGTCSPEGLGERLSDHRSMAWDPRIMSRFLAGCAIVLLSDYSLAHDTGYSGIAAFYLATAILLLIGIAPKIFSIGTLLISVSILLSITRMLWQGNVALTVILFLQISLLAVSLQGIRFRVPNIGRFILGLIPASCREMSCHVLPQINLIRPSGVAILSIAMPLGLCALFGLFFILANPNLIREFSLYATDFFDATYRWFSNFSYLQIVIWLGAGTFALGAMTPVLSGDFPERSYHNPALESGLKNQFYAPIRNMLVAVNVLFATYLIFEFSTLWLREFPVGFQYSGFAHQGAFWLTVALISTTITLSLMFRRSLMLDPRVHFLRSLAWLWIALNLLLAITVYHRLWIYVDFNGMTRMRVIGFMGVTCVVIGVILCAIKINSNRTFRWLIEAQSFTLAFAIYLLTILPTDWICHRYNVHRVLSGDLPPVVQITVQPISAEGWLTVKDLVHSKDPIIRDGVLAMLINREIETGKGDQFEIQNGVPIGHKNWRNFQWSEHLLGSVDRSDISSQSVPGSLKDKSDLFRRNFSARDEAVERLKQFAYQYY